MGIKAPNINSQSSNKRAMYKKFVDSIPSDVKITFHDRNYDSKIDPGEWIEYKDNGKRIVGYSPFGNAKNKDSVSNIAKKLNVSKDVIEKQIGSKVNPNAFLTLSLPIEQKTKLPKVQPKKSNIQVDAPKDIKPELFEDKEDLSSFGISDSTKIGEDKYSVYVVKKGDCLSKLSNKLKTSTFELKELNDLKGNSITAGQKLIYMTDHERNSFNTGISDEQYIKVLKKTLDGHFKGCESVILNAAKKNNIPISDLYSIMMHETNKGKSNNLIKNNNPGGLRKLGSTQMEKYSSLKEGIEQMAARLAIYYERGQDTLAKIKPTYCPDSDASDIRGLNVNWLSGTLKFKEIFLNSLAMV